MDLELFCATDRVVVTHGHNLLLRRMRLEFVQGEEQVKKKVLLCRTVCIERTGYE